MLIMESVPLNPASKTGRNRKSGRFSKKNTQLWQENVLASIPHRKRRNSAPSTFDSSRRRVTDLNKLAADLWCYKCKRPLSLRFVEKEIKVGFASVLRVRCDSCSSLFDVSTSRVTCRSYDVNLKAALGMLDSGMGPTSLNTFMSALNVPCAHVSLLKRHERKVGSAIETTAQVSCAESIELERKLEQTAQENNYLHSSPSFENERDCQSSNSSGELVAVLPSALGTGISATSSPLPIIHRKDSSSNCDNHGSEFSENASYVSVTETISNVSPIVSSSLSISSSINISRQSEERNSDTTNLQVSHHSCSNVIQCNSPSKSSTIGAPRTPTRELVPTSNGTGIVNIKASIDAGWQKRGSNRAYNSKTGHSSLMGYRSKKILSFATRKKSCRTCSISAKTGKVRPHDCRANHSKSSKAMEPAMAVELICQNPLLQEKQVQVSVVIGDDDSSTEAAVRRESVHPIEKWSDSNHSTKALTSALYNKNIPPNLHDYFRAMLGYAVKQNRDQPDKVRAAIISIPHHAFGDHSFCGTWCDGAGHVHKGLPKGRPLQDPNMKVKLVEIFQRFANNSEKLAPCGSSQANESFNNVVTSKHDKRHYYGDSESMDFRVSAAVCQKNKGTGYVVDVNKNLGLSPGEETRKFREKKDADRLMKRVKACTSEFKRRRGILRRVGKQKDSQTERKEGITYSSESGLDGLGANLIADEDQPVNITGNSVVVFDLETSGFGKKAEICQIAAVSLENNEVYSAYILPKRGINAVASEVTGLSVARGTLYLHGKEVQTTPPRVAMSQFIDFLKGHSAQVLLVAHNGHRFDAPILCQHLQEMNLVQEFTSVVTAFVDSLPLFKDKLPERQKQKQKFKQSDLASDLLGIPVDGAHNAVWDVRVLKDLLKTVKCSPEDLKKHALSVCKVMNADVIKEKHAEIQKSLENSLNGALSKTMLKKVASCNISIECLMKCYSDHGSDGVVNLFSEDADGRPRITKSNSIIKKVVSALQQLKESQS